MKRPVSLRPEDETLEIGRVFGTPLVVKRLSWIPLTEALCWWRCYRYLKREFPAGTRNQWLVYSALMTGSILGSEWGHNLTHAAAAHAIDRPMDAIRINLGMPLLVYFDVSDLRVTPREHIIRSIAGPVFNTILLLVFLACRAISPAGSYGRKVAEAGTLTNAFLCTASLTPIPDLDGGPILKWSLVNRGYGLSEADEIVRIANGPAALGWGLGSLVLMRFGKKILSLLAAGVALSSLAYALGWIRSED